MSEIFFISDTHFGHKGILTYEAKARPFDTIEAMNEHLISNWNKVVGPKDKVFHLGDAVFGKRNLHLLGELNGRIHLILGNHDLYMKDDYKPYIEKFDGAVEYHGCLLTHVPVHPDECGKGNRYWRNIHGHLHSKKLTSKKYVNVSVEQINLTPIPLDELWNIATEGEFSREDLG